MNPNIVKWYNIFTWMYLGLFRGKTKIRLQAVNRYSMKLAEAEGNSGSWWDMFDGMCWICSFVGTIIFIGYVRS